MTSGASRPAEGEGSGRPPALGESRAVKVSGCVMRSECLNEPGETRISGARPRQLWACCKKLRIGSPRCSPF
jgi:hypothetical protein